jgi:FkbH-like protein
MAFLTWLPETEAWASHLAALPEAPEAAWGALVALANARLDFVRTGRLAAALERRFPTPPAFLATRPVRLAVLGSATTGHLRAAIVVAALRRGIHLTVYENEYGQYLQELHDPSSALQAFRPDSVLFALDAHHLTAGAGAALDGAAAEALADETLARLETCWARARDLAGGPVLQQTILHVHPPLLGSNEHRLPGSRAALAARLDHALRARADAARVDLVAVDHLAARHGLAALHDPILWNRARQEISPVAAPAYGDLVGRLLAARQGRSAKCLVLDLDNTLWGGVIGDDGLSGIVLGPGSAAGEAFAALQSYVAELGRRGIILAVCSKNDEATAREAFERHPEMVLRLPDIACFVANWEDKPANLRRIAAALNIGLDSLVFLDDNPFERTLVRRELPMVAVPELPEDPALFPALLAEAGYFESLGLTAEDRARNAQYAANTRRATLQAAATDLPAYLRSLGMVLRCDRFDRVGLGRIVQLINKTNQFNLTTRRYTEDEVLAVMADPAAFGLQLRLADRFGDNGVIAIVIGRRQPDGDVLIDTWLMSCRVRGRQVEEATLNLIAAAAVRLGARRLLGEFRPTPKNAMVAEHYRRLGFMPADDSGRLWALDLAAWTPRPVIMEIAEREHP